VDRECGEEADGGDQAGALHLLGNADYLRTFTPDQLRTQALLKITEFHDIWTVGLVLFGAHLLDSYSSARRPDPGPAPLPRRVEDSPP
jgi:hypothetical protein